jgi:CheY-like chemotaxis protein
MAKILLIDDDTVLLKLYSTRLVADHHQVDTATNGEEGLQKLRQSLPDILVLDLLMPKINGFVFLATVNQDPRLIQIPKIVFSSVANQEQINRLQTLGVKHYLNKTDTTPTQLVKVINELLGIPPSTPSPP